MLVVDVRKAHLCAPATREVYIEIPKEDKREGDGDDVCGYLQFSMYGTRDAAKNWSQEVERAMGGGGLVTKLEFIAHASFTIKARRWRHYAMETTSYLLAGAGGWRRRRKVWVADMESRPNG